MHASHCARALQLMQQQSTSGAVPREAVLAMGFGIAVEYALSLGMDWVWDRVRQLAALLRERLSSLPGVTVHDRGRVLGGIVSFSKVRRRSAGCR